MAVNLHWGFKAVASELSALTGLPAKAANDANIAALGEAWKGAAEGAKNVILVKFLISSLLKILSNLAFSTFKILPRK